MARYGRGLPPRTVIVRSQSLSLYAGSTTGTGPVEAAATGEVSTGGLSAAEVPDTSGAATGVVTSSGSSPGVAPAVTSATAGAVTALAVSEAQVSAVTGSAAGVVVDSGVSSGSAPSVSGAASGAVLVLGSSSSTVGATTSAAAVAVETVTQSVFTDQTPNVTDATDSVYYTLVTRIVCGAAGSIVGVRYWMPDTAPTQVVGGLFSRTSDAAGTLLASKAFSTLTPGWQDVLFDTPVEVEDGADLYAAVWTDRYVYSLAFFTTDVTNGDLTAPADDSVTPARNGRFKVGGSGLEYPTGGGGTCYFTDVLFLATTAGDAAAATAPVQASATGTFTPGTGVTGAADSHTAPVTGAAAGTVTAAATAAAQVAPVTSSAAGTYTATATAVTQVAPVTSSAAGTYTPPAGGVSTAATAPVQAAATGTFTVSGQAAPTTSLVTAAATGTATPPFIEAAAATTTGPSTASVQGVVFTAATAVALVPTVSGAAPGSVTAAGASHAVTAPVAVTGTGVVDSPVYLAASTAATPPLAATATGTITRWPGLGTPATVPDLRAALIVFLQEHPASPSGLTVAGALADDLPAGLVPYAAVFEPPGPPPLIWCAIARSSLNLQVWHLDEKQARDTAETLRAITHDAPGRVIDGVTILSVTDTTGIGHVHDPGHPDLHRAVFTVTATGRWATAQGE